MKRSLLIVSAILALSGCTNPCTKLAEKVCDCEQVPSRRDSCIRQVNEAEQSQEFSDEDEERCEAKLDTCQCEILDTPAGKEACGLAWSAE